MDASIKIVCIGVFNPYIKFWYA